MSDARQRILDRLRANRPVATPQPPLYAPARFDSPEERITRFTERMQAVRGEVHRLPGTGLTEWLRRELPARGLHHILLGTDARGDELARAMADHANITRYDQPIEKWKAALFDSVDAAITGCRCAIADTGSLVLWPTRQEPRLMSLVPPVHIALLDGDTLYSNLAELIERQGWPDGMPTNALLVSGPSKTADIEQTLAYGIHGPKELVVLVLE